MDYFAQGTPNTKITNELLDFGKALSNRVDDDTIYVLIPKEYSEESFNIAIRRVKVKDNRVIIFGHEDLYFAHKDIIPCYYEIKGIKSKNKKIVAKVYQKCEPIDNNFSYEFICKLKIKKP